MEKQLKQGDLVKTIYGKTEEVLRVDGCQVITYESARQNCWYHIGKVWLISQN